MNSVSAQPAKLSRNVCRRCGISAPAPIVVKDTCSNAQACETRQRRPGRVVIRKHSARKKA